MHNYNVLMLLNYFIFIINIFSTLLKKTINTYMFLSYVIKKYYSYKKLCLIILKVIYNLYNINVETR